MAGMSLPGRNDMPSAETLRKEAEVADRFAAEDAAQSRLGFSLKKGKGRKNGAMRSAEDAAMRQVTNRLAHNPKRRWG